VLCADPSSVVSVETPVLGEIDPLRVLDEREIGLALAGNVGGELLADGPEAEQTVADVRWIGALLAAADALGAASTALERAVVYAGERQQFGVPIGSFQAVKHAIVDRYLDLQVGRALLAAASESNDVTPASAAMAKAWINQASVRAVDVAIQVHGAIGFTEELGLHLHQRRAMVDREMFAGTGTALAVVRHELGIEHEADTALQPATAGAPR
jgi:alkylation response protein AidB-like acyl-CoA dehydrogenase